MQTNGKIKVLLFDLGGVLLKLRDPIKTFGLPIDETEFMERWIRSPSVRNFESGGIDAEEFARNIVAESGMPFSWQEFLQRFDSWPERLYAETISVLDAIPAHYNRALLSNTNAVHWHRQDIGGQLNGFFNKTFLSYDTGLLKPDREAFELVAKAFDCRPDEVLFFDDNPVNVAAAADYGMQAVLAIGIGAVKKTLQERSVLT